jgi:hypothetical protein
MVGFGKAFILNSIETVVSFAHFKSSVASSKIGGPLKKFFFKKKEI